ncbi:MAG: LacI family DNA-binding transcriptional regulator [Hydrogenophaga sp.]
MTRPPRTAPRAPSEPKTAPADAAAPARGRKRMQMADIARLAGVSASTVSRALSGSPLIPEATRVRIAELAKSLNYRVNIAAANLRKQEVQTVGVVILGETMQAISDPFLLSILGTVADTLDEHGMSLLLTRLKDGQGYRLSEMVESGQVRGLIVIGQLTWHDQLNMLAARGIPMAVWGACLPDALYPMVGGDNEQGGYLATQHLIQQGCQKIAFFGDTDHPEAGARHQGYLKAMREAGIEEDARLQQPFLFGDKRIRSVIDEWLNRQLAFDAIFAASDVTAISIMAALKERGILVPDQVKVVGYDDIALAQHVHPSLSSISQPTLSAGKALVGLLLDAIAGHPKRTIVLPAKLVVRESSR